MSDGTEEKDAPTAGRGLAVFAVGVCVFLGGASVMIYEFVAVRFLAPFFGGTVNVWASEIAVCMAGLALGYTIGGLLADRFHSWITMGAVFVLAGLSGFPMEQFAKWSGEWLYTVDTALDWHPLVGALASSFLPLLALGTIMPQGIAMSTRRLEKVGSVSGLIIALSTVGSIVGVLAVGKMMTSFGVRQVLYGTSWSLIVLGVSIMIIRFGIQRGSQRISRPAASIAILFLFSPAALAQNIIFDMYSAYHHIIIEDTATHRLMRFDDDVESTMSLQDPNQGGFEYTDFFHVPKILDPTINRALFIGLGGGTGPKAFSRDYPNMRIDAVEIDPKVVEVAKKYFGVGSQRGLTIHINDGRVFLNRARGEWGVIAVDAYATGRYGAVLPYHLATQEFFEIVWNRLSNGGCLVFNAVGYHGGMNADVVAGLSATIRSVFQGVYVFEARTTVNTLFVAQKVDYEALDENGLVEGRVWPEGPWLNNPMSGSDLAALTEKLMASGAIKIPEMNQRVQQFSRAHNTAPMAEMLTDNYAPVDIAPTGR
jgi:spermidine synthase